MTGTVTSVTARLTETELAALDTIAEADGRSRSGMLRALVCDAAGLAEPERMRVFPRGWFKIERLNHGDLIGIGGDTYQVLDAGPTRVRAVPV